MKHLFPILISSMLLVSCSTDTDTFKATGKSEHWSAEVSYRLDHLLHSEGQLLYLYDTSPKEIKFEFVYPSGFPFGVSGTITHYQPSKEFQIGGGGGSINEGDTLQNLKEKVNQALIKVSWVENGEKKEEQIQIDVE